MLTITESGRLHVTHRPGVGLEGATKTGRARAGINIALVKYWGKRDRALNLPAVGSISLTLEQPGSVTEVRFGSGLGEDRCILDGTQVPAERVRPVLDAARRHAGLDQWAEVATHNSVPTASGLASSASGFAALSVAAWRAAGLAVADSADGLRPTATLMEAARIGSGSAARSLLGGFVEMDRSTGRVRSLLDPDDWSVCLVLGVLGAGPKATSSRAGMAHCEQTSPYFKAWVDSHPSDLDEARAAIACRNLERLGEVMEHSTLKMHACMMASRPTLIYWRPGTLAAVDAVMNLRRRGIGAWFTMDAGPHVKVLCDSRDQAEVSRALAAVPGVDDVKIARPGPGATVPIPDRGPSGV